MNLTLDPNAIAAAVAALRFRTQPFIDGQFVKSHSGETFTPN